MDREPKHNNAVTIDFILFGRFSCVFIYFCRAFLYITKMRFHHQLMRFDKTVYDPVLKTTKLSAGAAPGF